MLYVFGDILKEKCTKEEERGRASVPLSKLILKWICAACLRLVYITNSSHYCHFHGLHKKYSFTFPVTTREERESAICIYTSLFREDLKYYCEMEQFESAHVITLNRITIILQSYFHESYYNTTLELFSVVSCHFQNTLFNHYPFTISTRYILYNDYNVDIIFRLHTCLLKRVLEIRKTT